MKERPTWSGFDGYELSVRAFHVLMNAGIHTPEQLAELTEVDCRHLKRCGAKTVRELADVLRAEGLEFRKRVRIKDALKPYLADAIHNGQNVPDTLEELRQALAFRLVELMMRACQQ